MTNGLNNVGEEIVKKPVDAIQKRQDFINSIDDAIDEATTQVLASIFEDRARAEKGYKELQILFINGNNDPEYIREMNKAQELIQKTTDQIRRVLETLARVKTGDAKMQIAMIQQAAESANQDAFTREQLIELAEEVLEDNTR